MDVGQIIMGGIRTDCVSMQQLLDLLVRDTKELRMRRGLVRPRLVFDVNGHGVSLNASVSGYREALAKADIVHADGQPLVALSRLYGESAIPERTATTDMILDCAALAQARGIRFYLLGGSEELNKAAEAELVSRYPGIIVCGRRNGYFSAEEEAQVCDDISACEPDVVWVGLGKPLEQQFCVRNADRIDAAWLVTCGGCFNFLVGAYKRAPALLQNLGLEWLHRMLANPTPALVKRYLITNPHAMLIALFSTRAAPSRTIGDLPEKSPVGATV